MDETERAEQPDEGLKLLKVFMFLVDKNGTELKPEDYAMEIPEEFGPHMSFEPAKERFGKRHEEIMKKHRFDHAGGARTGAVVCARLLKLHRENQSDLAPSRAASIVSIGFVEGAGRRRDWQFVNAK